MTDILVTREDDRIIFQPETQEGLAWMLKNLASDEMRWLNRGRGHALAMTSTGADALIDEMLEAGLTLTYGGDGKTPKPRGF